MLSMVHDPVVLGSGIEELTMLASHRTGPDRPVGMHRPGLRSAVDAVGAPRARPARVLHCALAPAACSVCPRSASPPRRVRVRIGRPPGRQDPADFVLKDFAAAERKELGFHMDRAADAVEALLTGRLESAQNTFHVDPA
jgi:hypothetical protein